MTFVPHGDNCQSFCYLLLNHLTDVWTSDRSKITFVIIYSSLFESFNVGTLLKFYIKVKVLLLWYELV